ncbi:hypothetical protein [Halorarius halobius]|uniref:hypothetical protein n=1 Tax=Halorarius halobius TaxID=2962671 RepID=UPI0020CC4194|nr:hypothetical protein [Halorarius halobius]
MTVLIAAADDAGTAAHDALSTAGFDVERVTTLADARVRGATADVVVAGELADATARDLRGALREAGAATPVVRLGTAPDFEYAVEPPYEDALVGTVRLARQADAYRTAVDDLYERCRERAAAGESLTPDDEAVAAARRRAESAFEEVRRLGGHTPYERLFPEVEGSENGRGPDVEDADGDGQT